MGQVVDFPTGRVREHLKVSADTDRETHEKTLSECLNTLFPGRPWTPIANTKAAPVRRTFTVLAFLPVEYTIETNGGTIEQAAEYALAPANWADQTPVRYRYDAMSPGFIGCATKEIESVPGVFCTVREHVPEQFKAASRCTVWKVS